MEPTILTNHTFELQYVGQKTYDNHIKFFKGWLNGRQCTMDLITEYITQVLPDIYSPSSVANVKAALKKSIKKSVGDPANNVIFLATLDFAFKQLKCGTQDPKVYQEKILSEEEVQVLINNTPKKTSLMIKVFWLSGIRVSELCGIRLRDIHYEQGSASIKIRGKGKKERRVYLPIDLVEEIKSTFKSEVYLFTTNHNSSYSRHYIYRTIRRYGFMLLDREISPHTFRHSFVSHLLVNKKVDIKAVSTYCGHSSCSVTANMYLHSSLTPNNLFSMIHI